MKKIHKILSVIIAVIYSAVIGYVYSSVTVAAIILFAAVLVYLSGVMRGALGLTCAVISDDLDVQCDNPLTGGVSDTLYLMNKDEISTITRNGTNPRIIENITMKSGKRAYFYKGKNGSLKPSASMLVKKYAKPYDHKVDGAIFDITDATKEQLELLAQGLVVGVVENNYQNGTIGDTAFEVYGLEAGMELVKLERDPTNVDDLGAYIIGLQSRENAKEGKLPQTFFKTDYAATAILVTALLTPAP